MTPRELVSLAEMVYGWRWRSPLARALGVSRRLVVYYEAGERPIPAERADQIRRFADVGPVGEVIRATIRTVAPEIEQPMAHRIAKAILSNLVAIGMVASDLQHRSPGESG